MVFQKRIGLDIGQSSIKVAYFRSRLNDPPLISCFGTEFPQLKESDPGDKNCSATIRRLFRKHSLTGIPVAVSISCDSHMLRSVDLPFSDPEKVARVAPYEIEPLLPLPSEELAFAYGVETRLPWTRSPRTSESPVLVGAIQKTVLAEHLNLLAEARIDPVSIVPEELALLAAFAPVFDLEHNEAYAVVDIGASKTVACIYHPEHPPMFRSFDIGGNYITRLLAETQGLTLEEAERVKRGWNSPLDRGPLQPFVELLFQELRLVFHAYEAQAKCPVTTLGLSGGTAKLAGLGDLLAQNFRLKVARPHRKPRFATALALAAPPRRHCKTPFIDFRKGVQLTGAVHTAGKRRSQWLAASLVLVALLGLADGAVHYALKESHYQNLKADLRQRFLAQFPNAVAVDEIHQMRVALKESKAQLTLLGAEDHPLMTTLADLNRQLTLDMPLTITDLVIEPQLIQMEVETNSFAAVENIKSRLAKLPTAKEVRIDKARAAAEPGKVVFRAIIPLSVEHGE